MGTLDGNCNGGDLSAGQVQGNILRPYARAHAARMVLYHFEKPDAARKWVSKISQRVTFHGGDAGTERALDVKWNVAFTFAGLATLGLGQAELAEFPDAFRETMAGRASRLREAPASKRPIWLVSDESVHAAVMLYVTVDGDEELHTALLNAGSAVRGMQTDPSQEVLSKRLGEQTLAAVKKKLEAVPLKDLSDPGIVQIGSLDLFHPLEVEKSTGARDWAMEMFGFREGFNQPRVLEDERVRAAFVMDTRSPILRHGSYMVVRQLQQDVAGFWLAMQGAAKGLQPPPATEDKQPTHKQTKEAGPTAQDLAERIIGRRMNGTPLGSDATTPPDLATPPFDPRPDADAGGAVCPFHSHVRRVGPRFEHEVAVTPRLIRRGLSYADPASKTQGLMFIAFNADISAQFEFIQRNWIQGGNSIGMRSTDRDPLVGLAPPGSPATPFSCKIADRQIVLDLPVFIQLQWGEYFFVPSKKALDLLSKSHDAGITSLYHDDISTVLAHGSDETNRALIHDWIEDPALASRFWAFVEAGGGYALGRQKFIADAADTEQILADDGRAFSVCEYNRRMLPITGRFFLGMDTHQAEYQDELRGAVIIPGWTRHRDKTYGPCPGDERLPEVQRVARDTTTQVLAAANGRAATSGSPVARLPLAVLLGNVLDSVSKTQFGVPGASSTSLLLGAGDLTKYFFRGTADHIDGVRAQDAGPIFRRHFERLFLEAERHPEGNPKLTTILKQMRVVYGRSVTMDKLIRNLVGIVSGSLSATFALFSAGLNSFVGERADRSIQFPATTCGKLLFDQMLVSSLRKQRRGGPDSLHRVCTDASLVKPLNSRLQLEDGDHVVVWLGNAAAKPNSNLLFGGARHHCPGELMAKVLLEGVLEALRDFRPLRLLAGDALEFTVVS